jgi:hypothetical protein
MGKQNQTHSAPRASSLASGTQGPGKPVRTIIQFAQRSITGMLTMHNAAGFWSPESLQHLANMTWVVTGARCVADAKSLNSADIPLSGAHAMFLSVMLFHRDTHCSSRNVYFALYLI